jgi:hypothetical protein
MYVTAIILLMLVLPVASVAIEASSTPDAELMALIGNGSPFGASASGYSSPA